MPNKLAKTHNGFWYYLYQNGVEIWIPSHLYTKDRAMKIVRLQPAWKKQ